MKMEVGTFCWWNIHKLEGLDEEPVLILGETEDVLVRVDRIVELSPPRAEIQVLQGYFAGEVVRTPFFYLRPLTSLEQLAAAAL